QNGGEQVVPNSRALPCLRAALLVARHPALPAMASLSVLTFDHEGRPIQFDMWLDDLHLYLLSDSRDSISLFDHTSGASLAPPATADNATRSQWLTRDSAAHLAVRNHLPLVERAHFGITTGPLTPPHTGMPEVHTLGIESETSESREGEEDAYKENDDQCEQREQATHDETQAHDALKESLSA
ncbi:unnamed protein product, partial [Closterium sp. NIES-53]